MNRKDAEAVCSAIEIISDKTEIPSSEIIDALVGLCWAEEEVYEMKNPFVSKGNWVFERSSGYAGCRCTKCNTWLYEGERRECGCDK